MCFDLAAHASQSPMQPAGGEEACVLSVLRRLGHDGPSHVVLVHRASPSGSLASVILCLVCGNSVLTLILLPLSPPCLEILLDSM